MAPRKAYPSGRTSVFCGPHEAERVNAIQRRLVPDPDHPGRQVRLGALNGRAKYRARRAAERLALAAAVRHEREAAGLTVEAVCRVANLEAEDWSAYEDGGRPITPSVHARMRGAVESLAGALEELGR